MTIRELEILKAALEGDIIRQKKSEKADHPEWKQWLQDSEKVLKKVNIKLAEEMTKESYKKQAEQKNDKGLFFKGYRPNFYFKTK
ncbi:hypothetical protein [Bacillus sp. UMB0728]|uniref:hypothetical protein n=1 Tax=Bacillus sp. UMB0728 TaxID=2066052 RepID=UPI000C756219|nr:hypothetical protein [Bacillus sp. UMB0728]PLR72240.1 hypothetical protein CYJ37_11840 [Bacillus sp. UMB0728]